MRNISPIKNSHCSYCGAKFSEQILWPRKCFICYNESYSNPPPVSVSLVKVMSRDSMDHGLGILLVKRSIEPAKDTWALPGGYIISGESWQEGACRELREETGVNVAPSQIKVIDVITGPTTGNLLIFNEIRGILYLEDIEFIPNNEVSAIDVAYSPRDLGFFTHTQALADYFTPNK